MFDLAKACRSCSVCWKGGIANHPRILKIESHGHVPNAPILVIDDMPHVPTVDDWDTEARSYEEHYWRRISFTRTALVRICDGIPFTYTQAIRCHSVVLTDSDINPAVACAVWTHNLTEGRKVIITGRHGFNQMKLPHDRFEFNKLYRFPRLGLIYTVPPIDEMADGLPSVAETATRMIKVLKEAKLK
jgi:hypothetical protein